MEQEHFFQRFRQLQSFVRWTSDDEQRIPVIARTVTPAFPALVDDFFLVIQQDAATSKVLQGGAQQVERLKQSLRRWLQELMSGVYDEQYVARRLNVGRRHVAIGLDQIYTNVAMSRLRSGITTLLRQRWHDETHYLIDAISTLNKLLDLDLAIIGYAYEAEHLQQLQVAERVRMTHALHQEKEFSEGLLERVLQAERLAGIGQMITGLAHESRNALQRIQACAELLELVVEDNREALDLVARINLAQDHLHRLFDEVRGYAAPLNLDCSDCHLGAIWREAWELLLPQWEGRIAELIELDSPAPLSIHADPFRLVQMFRILLENALAACQDPVRIEIACHTTELAGEDAIEISVRDNGPGLNQQQQNQIFEPFYTTKTKGTGLGMAIAQRIVAAHHGTIEVANNHKQGAELVVTLPYRAPMRR